MASHYDHCSHCGANDYHGPLECDPAVRRAFKIREDAIFERGLRAQRAAKALLERLKILGLPAKLDTWSNRYTIQISGLDLLDTEHEGPY